MSTQLTQKPSEGRPLALRSPGWRIALLIGLVLLSLAAGAAGQALGGGPTAPGLLGRWLDVEQAWYGSLKLPPYQPPGWLFAPVWTLLYVLIGVAAWMVVKLDDPARRTVIGLLIAHWFLNVAWTAIFFGLHKPGWALADLLALWIVVFVLIVVCWRMRRVASILLLPYLAWLSYASLLNAAILALN